MVSRGCLEVLEQTKKKKKFVPPPEKLSPLYRLSHTRKKTNKLAFTKILVFVLKVDFKTNIKSGANYSVSCFLTFWIIIFQQGMMC